MRMRKQMFTPFVIAVFLILPRLGLGSAMMSIQIKEGVLRSTPSFMGKIVARVSYGDRVETLESKSGWSKVRSSQAIPGWIHDSALTHKKIVLTAGKRQVEKTATGDEIALAGKGFNKQVEQKYKAKKLKKEFKMIDQMEKIVVSDHQMRRFLEDGRLSPEGGDQ